MLNIGGWELMIILLVALVVLGPQRLPEVARQMGQTVSTLRSLAGNFQAEIDAAAKPDATVGNGDSAMSLSGPTNQADAIAQTQPDGVPESDTDGAAEDPPEQNTESAPIVTSAPFAAVKTDPALLAEQARAVQYDDEDDGHSSGGPVDLRDEEE